MYIYIYIQINICVYLCIYVYLNVYVYIYIGAYARMYINVYASTRIPPSSFNLHRSASVLAIHHSAFMYVCVHAKKYTGLFVLYFYEKLIKYGIQSSPWYIKNQKLTV